MNRHLGEFETVSSRQHAWRLVCAAMLASGLAACDKPKCVGGDFERGGAVVHGCACAVVDKDQAIQLGGVTNTADLSSDDSCDSAIDPEAVCCRNAEAADHLCECFVPPPNATDVCDFSIEEQVTGCGPSDTSVGGELCPDAVAPCDTAADCGCMQDCLYIVAGEKTCTIECFTDSDCSSFYENRVCLPGDQGFFYCQ